MIVGVVVAVELEKSRLPSETYLKTRLLLILIHDSLMLSEVPLARTNTSRNF